MQRIETDRAVIKSRRSGYALFRQDRSYILSGSKNHNLKPQTNRSKESISRLSVLRGSLAIETAMVLPLFLFFLLTLLSLFQLLAFSVRLQNLLYNEAIACSEHAYDRGNSSLQQVTGRILGGLADPSHIPVEGASSGLNFGNSDLSDPEFVYLEADYTAKLLFDPFRLFSRPFCQHVLFHTWIGYEKGLSGMSHERGEIMVYVTENSEVYHRSSSCTHIRLKIEEISSADLAEARNAYGDRYKACRHCHAKKGAGTLYITTDGDCYHSSLGCSGLTRSVRAIPLSEVGGRRPCSRCGY